MAQMYKNIKSGIIAELMEINDKTGMVTLKKKDGKFTASGKLAFEKYWKLISDDKKSEPVVEDKQIETKEESAVAPATEAKDEPTKKEKAPKADKPKKEKKPKKVVVEDKSEEERLSIRDSFIKSISSEDVVTNIPANYPLWIDVKIGEKNAFGIGLNTRNIRVRAIKETLPNTVSYHDVKGGFSAGLTFSYDDISSIVDLVKYVSDNFKDSDILKKKRKEKSEKPEKKEHKKSEKVEKEEEK